MVLEQLRLDKGVSVTTPLVKCKEEDMDKDPLGAAEAALYRSIAMRIGYLSMDRPDMSRTVRELAKGLKEPLQYHWGLLKRAARTHSLPGTVHMHQCLVRQRPCRVY